MPSTRQMIAYALVAIGALWLLIETGFVPPRLTAALFAWWPLLLVGLGLDLVIPKAKRGPLPVTFYAAGAILLLALLGVPATRAAATQEYSEALPLSARSMAATITLGSTPTTVGSAPSGVAVQGEFVGEPPGLVSLNGAERLELELRAGRGSPFRLGRSHWSVALTPALPLDLELRTGSGASTLQLQDLDLSSLTLESGSGRTSVTLPGGGQYYAAAIGSGSGRLDVQVQPGASLDLTLQTGSGAANLTIGEGSDLQLTLSARSGAVTVDLPDEAPIRLEVLSDGSGRLNVPPYLTRRSGNGDKGVWESAAYANGGRVLNITVADARSGSITFR